MDKETEQQIREILERNYHEGGIYQTDSGDNITVYPYYDYDSAVIYLSNLLDQKMKERDKENLIRTGQQYTLIDFGEDGIVIIKNGEIEINAGIQLDGETGIYRFWGGSLRELIARLKALEKV